MTMVITDAELELMRLLWKESPLNAREITDRLQPEKQWHRKTVNTLLSRLEKKSAVQVQKQPDGLKYFAPGVDEGAYMSMATSNFVDRLFGGDIAPLVASFAQSRSLNPDQVASLKGLLNEFSDDD